MAVRRKYTRDFKQDAVQLVRSAEVPASQIARDLGIEPNMLSRGCPEVGAIENETYQGKAKPREGGLAEPYWRSVVRGRV